MSSMAGERPYRSPLREQQARQTRTLILQALVDLIAAQGAAELSIRELASKAGVSQRTVYRYFPDRAALVDGLLDHLSSLAGWGDPLADMTSISQAIDYIPLLFASYEKYPSETRAAVLLNLDPARASRLTQRNRVRIRALLATEYPVLTRTALDEASAVLHLLASSSTWLRFRDLAGLDPEEAVAATTFAMRAVLAELDRACGRSTSA